MFEEHLQKLESMSTQLMSHKSAPAPYSAADLFADGLEPETNAPGMAGVQPAEAATDDSMGYPFIIVDFTPEWDYTVGGAKMIVTCSFVANCNVDISTVRLHVQIDREEVGSNRWNAGSALCLDLDLFCATKNIQCLQHASLTLCVVALSAVLCPLTSLCCIPSHIFVADLSKFLHAGRGGKATVLLKLCVCVPGSGKGLEARGDQAVCATP